MIPNSKQQRASFELSEPLEVFKEKLLLWADTFDICSVLDSNAYEDDVYGEFDFLAAVGAQAELLIPKGEAGAFDALKKWQREQQPNGWIFGFFSYDLKNEIEPKLQSNNPDRLDFPLLHFFKPTILITKRRQCSQIEILSHTLTPLFICKQIATFAPKRAFCESTQQIKIQDNKLNSRINKQAYVRAVDAVKQRILEGDVYELNFCQEFFIENVEADAITICSKLGKNSNAPFGGYYKNRHLAIVSASPERFLKKIEKKIVSQPMKGTTHRGVTEAEDEHLRQGLAMSEKNRAENVMIVDLVRNDMARVCEYGSVQVTDLFKVQTFKRVHQMISTVEGRVRKGVHFVEVIKSLFPMGSMTGAPKMMSMQLIETYENTRRSAYSGALGYITPEENFDFNVLIRSIFFNKKNTYISFSVGSAIVQDSVSEEEYEECLLKAKAIIEVLKEVCNVRLPE